MRRPARTQHIYDGPMYEALAKDIAGGLSAPSAEARLFEAVTHDHRVTGATAAAITRRLTFHNVPQQDGRAWQAHEVDAMLEKFRWAAFDARQAAHRQLAESRKEDA